MCPCVLAYPLMSDKTPPMTGAGAGRSEHPFFSMEVRKLTKFHQSGNVRNLSEGNHCHGNGNRADMNVH